MIYGTNLLETWKRIYIVKVVTSAGKIQEDLEVPNPLLFPGLVPLLGARKSKIPICFRSDLANLLPNRHSLRLTAHLTSSALEN